MADLQRKTANLFDESAGVKGYYINASGEEVASSYSEYEFAHTQKILVEPEMPYTYSLSVQRLGMYRRIVGYDENKNYIRQITDFNVTGSTGFKHITFTTPQNCHYITINYVDDTFASAADLNMMLNTGTSAEPYEPYGWVHSLRMLTTATEAVENPLYSDGTAITSYTIKGNTVQSGAPSPSNPVMPQGTGDKTAQLYNKNGTDTSNGFVNRAYLNTTGEVGDSANHTISEYIDISAFEQITLSGVGTTTASITNVFYNANHEKVSYFVVDVVPKTVNVPSNAKYIRLTVANTRKDTLMLNDGSTALDYEPYGYKIQISSGGVTTPIYLNEPLMGIATADEMASSGTVTRAYKKVVLNSNTIIRTYTTQWGIAFVIYVSNVSSGAGSALIDAVCSHYNRNTRDNIWRQTGSTLRAITLSGENNAFLISDPTYTTLQDFEDYVGTQYNNGTPITVIVAVTTPTTETVTAPSIPTTEGANSITVDTTVQPSEFTATWTGWHNASVKEYGAAGANKFDYTTMASGITGYYLTSAGVETESNAWAITDYIPCNGQSFTLGKIGGNAPSICLYDSNKTFIAGQAYNTGGADFKKDITVTASQNAKYIRFSYFIASPADDLSAIMLNEGTTALPYEPYEYGWV